ncbi:MAG: hypothetical protein ACI8P0_002058 [Planctomycetaceae bacterium]|jgi:hypothetical protein
MDCEDCCVEPADVFDVPTWFGVRSLCSDCRRRAPPGWDDKFLAPQMETAAPPGRPFPVTQSTPNSN